jgi:2-iminobutanoate/2-iminopropanoate deaminase
MQMKRVIFLAVTCLVFTAMTARPQSAEFKNPPELSKPNGYSHIVIANAGKLVIISGQTGFNNKGEIQKEFSAQVRQAFENLKIALSAAGAKPADVVKLHYYVVGLNHEKLLAVRAARDSFINREHPPASTLVGVQSLFSEEAQVEIEAEAEAVLP